MPPSLRELDLGCSKSLTTHDVVHIVSTLVHLEALTLPLHGGTPADLNGTKIMDAWLLVKRMQRRNARIRAFEHFGRRDVAHRLV